MSKRIKQTLLVLAICILLFSIIRIGTSTYENHIRSIGSVPYAQ